MRRLPLLSGLLGLTLLTGAPLTTFSAEATTYAGTVRATAGIAALDAAQPPVVGVPRASSPTVLPYGDGYLDSVDVSVAVSGEAPGQTVRLEVLDGPGSTVATFPVLKGAPGTFVFHWNGVTTSGATAAPGTYTFRARATDSSGTPADWTYGGSVDVDASRLVSHSARLSVAARDSRLGSTVGRCSRLRTSSSRGWHRSLALQSGQRCRSKRAADLLVSTVHSVRLPALPHATGPDRYDTLEVQVFGGAARKRAQSTATLRYLNARGVAGSARTLGAPVGYHEGHVRNAAGLVRPDGTFRWTTSTSGSSRYDVKHYLLTVTYSVLEPATP